MPNKRSEPSKSIAPFILIGVGAVLIIAVLLWQLAQNRPASSAVVPASPTLTVEQVERVTAVEAKKALENKEAVVVDVRSLDAFTMEHVAGAINIPLAQIGTRSSELKTDEWIITYCT
jgi:3-mercaptopyruvate sulfurtransferase SseA